MKELGQVGAVEERGEGCGRRGSDWWAGGEGRRG